MDAKMEAGAKKLHPGAQNGPTQALGELYSELFTLQGRFLAPPGDPKITQKISFNENGDSKAVIFSIFAGRIAETYFSIDFSSISD